jgi:hypothetical protein
LRFEEEGLGFRVMHSGLRVYVTPPHPAVPLEPFLGMALEPLPPSSPSGDEHAGCEAAREPLM